MLLVKILVEHSASKSRLKAVDKFIVCDNEDQVFNYLYPEEYIKDYEMSEEQLQDYQINRGSLFSDFASYDDLYYGVFHYGWEKPVEISDEQLKVLKDLNLVEDLREIMANV